MIPKYFVLLCASFVLLCGCNLSKEIEHLEKLSWVAWRNNDSNFFRQFLAADHVEVGTGGSATKAEVAAGVANRASEVDNYGAQSYPPSQFVDSVPFLQGTIGGHGPYWFLIDTGANRSAIDQRLISELGLPTESETEIQGAGGTIRTKTVTIPQLQLGSVQVENLKPTVYDLSTSLSPKGDAIAGIIGFDVLQKSVVLFDFKLGRVTVSRTEKIRGASRGVVSIPFVLDNGIPKLTITLDDTPIDLRLDSGASFGPTSDTYLNITESELAALREREKGLMAIKYFSASGTGGNLTIPVFKAKKLTIAGLDLKSPFLIVQPRAGYFALPNAVGFIGLYTLRSWTEVLLDYPNQKLTLYR